LIGQDALLDGFFDDRMVIQHRPLHFIGKTQFHGCPPGGHKAMLDDWDEQEPLVSYSITALSHSSPHAAECL
jgi:hypothetical protein